MNRQVVQDIGGGACEHLGEICTIGQRENQQESTERHI